MKRLLSVILVLFLSCGDEPTNLEFGNPFDSKNDLTPFTLKANIDNGGITLTWSKIENESLKNYMLYKSISKDSNYVKIGIFSPEILTYIDTEIVNGYSYWYYITAANNAGQETSRSKSATINIKSDPVFIINGGEGYTNSNTVNLTILAHTAKEMIISNNSKFDGNEWEDYSTSKEWTLTPGDGRKTVYLKVKYESSESDTICSEIVFDSVPPNISFIVEPDSGITNETNFILDPTGCSDNLSEIDSLKVRFDYDNDGEYDSNWKSASSIQNKIFSTGGGNRTIKMQLTDGAWQIDTTYNIFVNTRPFSSFTVSLDQNNNKVYHFNAEASHDYEDSTSIQLRWDFDGNGVWDTELENITTVTYEYQGLGKFNPVLNVTDSYRLSNTSSQELTVKPNIVFEQILDNGYSAQSICRAGNDGFIITGSAFIDAQQDIWLVKTDTSGNILWEQTYDGTDWSRPDSVRAMDYATDVQITQDGGYIIMGTNDVDLASNSFFWLIKTDANGNIEWDQKYGSSYENYASAVRQTNDNGYIMCGSSQMYFKLLKCDMNGLLVWEKTLNIPDMGTAGSVIVTNEGDYVSVGAVWPSSSLSDFYLVKVDEFGNIIWDNTYGGNGYDQAEDILLTSDGEYLIVGYTSSKGSGEFDIWLVKTDTDGNMIWDKTLGGSGNDQAYDICSTSDGGFIIAGGTESYGIDERDYWIIKIDSDGNLEWDQTLGGPGYDYALSVAEISTDKYLVVGTSCIAILK